MCRIIIFELGRCPDDGLSSFFSSYQYQRGSSLRRDVCLCLFIYFFVEKYWEQMSVTIDKSMYIFSHSIVNKRFYGGTFFIRFPSRESNFSLFNTKTNLRSERKLPVELCFFLIFNRPVRNESSPL
jgi:hypothetical protein